MNAIYLLLYIKISEILALQSSMLAIEKCYTPDKFTIHLSKLTEVIIVIYPLSSEIYF